MLNSRTLKMVVLVMAGLVKAKKMEDDSARALIQELSELYCKFNPSANPNYLMTAYEKKVS